MLTIVLLSLIAACFGTGNHPLPPTQQHDVCTPTILRSNNPRGPPQKAATYLSIATEASKVLAKFATKRHANITREATFVRTIFNQHTRIFAIAIISPEHPNLLAYRKRDRLLIHRNRTFETDPFWQAVDLSHNLTTDWTPPFRDCTLNRGTWYEGFVATEPKTKVSVAIFVPVVLDQCDPYLAYIFGGPHQCDTTSTECVPKTEYGLRRGGYKCVCRERFYFPNSFINGSNLSTLTSSSLVLGGTSTRSGFFSGDDVENGVTFARCLPCPEMCDKCDRDGQCMANPDLLLRTGILGVQLTTMTITVIIAIVVFRQRKCKTIACGMWTILETILVGIFLLYATVVVRFFEPSIERCLIEPWTRELGFIICYGAIVLKLYRHLIDFRTRKAHRWVVKDTDLLKYLFVMVMAVLAYMAAFTATSLNFLQENYTLLTTSESVDGLRFIACKQLWWDYVTEIGEIVILVFGVHLSFASRNAATQFQERRFLCISICVELLVSGIFYILRALYSMQLHPDHEYLAYFVRSQLTSSTVLLLLFIPKLWYQHKQARSLAQEFSCRLPVDAFKPDVACNTHGPLMSNNSDVDVGEISLADMSPDDIRAELKRLYTQLEILKNKTLRANNPHISKRRGGRKVAHRRFSLQALHGKHHKSHKHQASEMEVTEGEVSRTPEDSVCSGEGPSAIYNDLASTYSELIGTPNAAAICKPQSSSYSQ